ncbi:MAG: hypothetical protein PHV11_10405 [Candidatus Bipolaricaulis sp.]|nr:hypothetical protein [Candidatus Bipolaricaulis sp.]
MEEPEEIIEDLSKYTLPTTTLGDIKLENIISNKILTSPMLLGGAKMKLGSGNKCMGFLPDKGLWLGHADYDSAPAKISMAGVIYGTGAVIDGTSTIGGRLASTLASAIDSFGELITDTLNTSAKTILSDFTFSPDDYAGAFKTGDITWNTTTGAITGGTGIVINKLGIIGASGGVTKFSILTTGDATFAGTLSAASGTLGSITIGANAWHVDASGNMWWGSDASYAAATKKISSSGTFQGIFQGSFATGNNQFFAISGTTGNSRLDMINGDNHLYLKYSTGIPNIEIHAENDAGVTFLTLEHTGASGANLVSLITSSTASVIAIDKNNKGPAISIDTDSASDDDDTYGIQMDIECSGTGREYAFKFDGSEKGITAAGNSGFVSNSKGTFTLVAFLRINTDGSTYYIPYGTIA